MKIAILCASDRCSKGDCEDRNSALNPNKSLKFKDAIVYVNGEHCKKKKTAISDGDQIWLLSPAAGG